MTVSQPELAELSQHRQQGIHPLSTSSEPRLCAPQLCAALLALAYVLRLAQMDRMLVVAAQMLHVAFLAGHLQGLTDMHMDPID